MKDLIRAVDELHWIVKLVLCLPALNIIWGVYRILKGIVDNDKTLLIIGILWIVPGAPIAWIWDLVTTIMDKHPRVRVIW